MEQYIATDAVDHEKILIVLKIPTINAKEKLMSMRISVQLF